MSSSGCKPMDAILYTMEGLKQVKHIAKRCVNRRCRTYYAYNFKSVASEKINSVKLDEVDALFVNDKVGFSKQYLQYHEALHFRGFTSARAVHFAGSEVLFSKEMMHSQSRWRECYMNARFLSLVMAEMQDKDKPAAPFCIGREIAEEDLEKYECRLHNIDFLPRNPQEVKEVCIDGHEKVMPRCSGPPPRRAGRPRSSGRAKPYDVGWFMATHPSTRRVLAMTPLTSPENNQVAIDTVEKLTKVYPNLNCVIYDRSCRLEPSVKKSGLFPTIKYWPVDKFHACHHKTTCPNNPLQVLRLKRRVSKINTSAAEQTFSWFRNYARMANELRPIRHRFLMLHYCKKHNALMDDAVSQHLDRPLLARRVRTGVPYDCSGVFKRPSAGGRV